MSYPFSTAGNKCWNTNIIPLDIQEMPSPLIDIVKEITLRYF